MKDCPNCEYHKQRAQLWRHEAYKLSGHPLDWEPDLMQRPWVGLTPEEVKEISLANRPYVVDMVVALEARLKEKNHGT